ncbi:PD-(D/E)XK nuclease family protein [Dehalococcoides mccartyi]|uniref:PD-(D/E)XK nuclease family protein n=1 Tax=Dehalococcoides mccartyi TaxID=61435 RepID=UPI00130EC068|nr:PD-(D/E)XK nuclease family protein [Dehalococcoides mccartyi]
MAFDLPDFSKGEETIQSPSSDSIRKVAWSYSRRGTLEQCPRRYYYTYYASNGLFKNGNQEIKFVKRLQNRHERTGQILHLVISTFLRKARSGESWTTSRLCSWAENLFKQDCERSRNVPVDIENGISDFDKATYLQEFYYREPEAEAICESAKNRLLTAVAEFAENEVFAGLRNTGINPQALIEYPIKLIDLPCRATGRIDLAHHDADEAIVVDWKMGGTQGGDDSLQLATYGMWATTHFGVSPDRVHIHKALLVDGNLTSSLIDERMIMRAKVRIIQDAEQMAALDNYGRTGILEAFTPCAQRAVCALCRFRKLCEEGRACSNA